jgi:hypothetical protein
MAGKAAAVTEGGGAELDTEGSFPSVGSNFDIARFFRAWKADVNERAAVTLGNTFQIPGATLKVLLKRPLSLYPWNSNPLTHKAFRYYSSFSQKSHPHLVRRNDPP